MSYEFDNKRVWGPTPKYQNVLNYKKQNDNLIVIAGPCSVENEKMLRRIAFVLSFNTKENCDVFLRGGVYRYGTYPPSDPGLKINRLKILSKVAKEYGLKSIVEVLDVRDVEKIAPYVDAFQVGARHMQDYALLRELASSRNTVTLKRNMGATLDEFLGAAEYLAKGKCKPILIERGSSTHMNHVRWDLSISTIAAIKQITNIPIIVDASHGTGRRDLVEPMTLAGIAAGADGFLIEVHPTPEESLTDTDQAFSVDRFPRLISQVKKIKEIL